MENEERPRTPIVYPDYMNGVDDHTKHLWLKWKHLSDKIDNHPERFQDIMNQHTGAVKTLDHKASVGLSIKWAKTWGASEAELKEVQRIGHELQKLKTLKGTYNKEWSKLVYGKKMGDKTILDVRHSEIIDLYAKFYSTAEIVKFITDKWGLAIKFEMVMKFFVDHKDKIERLRAEYVLSGKDVRLATDVGRLELLSKLAWEMECKFEKNKTIEVSKELRSIVEQIRKEVKGEEIRLTIDGKIDINATIQANQTLHEALQKLPINMIVIGLTAAKQQLNPAILIGNLANSYYSQFNGFNKLKDKSEIMLPGQYIKSYNWDEIRRKNEAEIVDVETIDEVCERMPEIKKIEAKSGKQKMLEMLNAVKEQTR